jgi:1,4-dihydroxy-2-naphthoate octaprenyltransferase
MTVTGIISYWALLIFLSLPVALKNMKEISSAEVNSPQNIAMLDIKTAQLHTQFGLLLTVGILISYFF